MLLSIDTSTRYGGVATASRGHVVHSHTWLSTHNHTVELMPAVDDALRASGVTVNGLDGIAVALGPGGFSSLRVGLAVAKGLALATGKPLVGVRTLEMEAYPYFERGMPVCAMLPAGRGQVAWAVFIRGNGPPMRTVEERLGTIEEMVPGITTKTLFCGEGAPSLATTLHERLGDRAQVMTGFNPQTRLEALAAMGAMRLARGERDRMESLEPFYLRPPSIGRMNTPQLPKEET